MPMFYINYTEFSLTRFAFHSSAPQAMLKIICYLKSVLTSKKSKQSYNIQGEVCRQTDRRTDNLFMINKMTSSLFNITFNLSLKEMRRWLKSIPMQEFWISEYCAKFGYKQFVYPSVWSGTCSAIAKTMLRTNKFCESINSIHSTSISSTFPLQSNENDIICIASSASML